MTADVFNDCRYSANWHHSLPPPLRPSPSPFADSVPNTLNLVGRGGAIPRNPDKAAAQPQRDAPFEIWGQGYKRTSGDAQVFRKSQPHFGRAAAGIFFRDA